jgi:hypothetical protein
MRSISNGASYANGNSTYNGNGNGNPASWTDITIPPVHWWTMV